MDRITEHSSENKDYFDEYERSIRTKNTQPAKILVISDFLRKTFDVSIEDLALGAEKYIKSKVLEIRGRTDLLLAGVVLEIKIDLRRELKDAEEEVERYMKILRELRKDDYISIVTDGIVFKSYKLGKDNKPVCISEVSIDEGAEKFIIWLDSYLFTRRNVKPTANDLQGKFGLQTPTYNIVLKNFAILFDKIKSEHHANLKMTLWKKYLEIVYGSTPDEEEFLAHSYIVTLVKLIMYLRLRGNIEWDEIEKALDGSYFTQIGIVNFIEDDFYSWMLDPKIKNESMDIIKKLVKQLSVYDFESVDEDLFKEIYQEIVGPGTRHRIGEYYTPEWLAKKTIIEAMKISDKNFPHILDPACGSGTFLTNSIFLFKEKLKGQKASTKLNMILSRIMGIDINPLAVIIARANYIIALGKELIISKSSSIVIPVFVADSIKLAEVTTTLHQNVKAYSIEVPINGKSTKLWLPQSVVIKEDILNETLSLIRELTVMYRLGKISKSELSIILETRLESKLAESVISLLKVTLKTLSDLIDQDMDTIWVFVMRNLHAPIRFQWMKFDILVGNPPWIAFRYVDNKEYQEFLKQQVFDYGLLSPKEINLFTQMEMATLFFQRCADLYLFSTGIIAFVMPRSVLTGAKHHQKFKEFKKPKIKLMKILDLEKETNYKVSPLFNVPSCVLIGQKGKETNYPVETIAFNGKLNSRNSKLEEVESLLKESKYLYKPIVSHEDVSYYHSLFKAGAAIYPRPLWFIDFDADKEWGLDPDKPKIKSSVDSIKNAKGEWKTVLIDGEVESEFIFYTLLSKNIKPFGYDKLYSIVVPVEINKNKYEILGSRYLKTSGRLGISNWLERAQNAWNKTAGQKDKKNFPNVESSINHLSLLTSQEPAKRFYVLSATSGSNTMACVLDTKELKQKIGNKSIKVNFIAEKTTFFYQTDDEQEAYYLAAVISSRYLDKLIKPLQARGSFGARHIQRIPFQFPIPRFDQKDKFHIRLAELAKVCSSKVVTMNGSRNKIKQQLPEMNEIDDLVEGLLS